MSEKYHTFTCVFENPLSAGSWYEIFEPYNNDELIGLDKALVEKGFKPIAKRLDDPVLEDVSLENHVLRLTFMTRSGENIPSGFVKDLSNSGANLIVKNVIDLDSDSGPSTMFFKDGTKTAKKDIKQYMDDSSLALKFLISSAAYPRLLPKIISDCGGYDAVVFGKPILFHVFDDPDRFRTIIEDCLKHADLSILHPKTGENIVTYLVRKGKYSCDDMCDLVRAGADALTPNQEGRKPIFTDLDKCGCYSIFIKFGGEDPNVLDVDGMPVYHKLAQRRPRRSHHEELVKLGADINYVSPYGSGAWLLRKTSPVEFKQLKADGAIDQKGRLTYSGNPAVDILTSIEFQDVETLKIITQQVGNEELLILSATHCLVYGFAAGLSIIEDALGFQLDCGYKVSYKYSDKEYKHASALVCLLDNVKHGRVIEDYLAVAKGLIEQSDNLIVESLFQKTEFKMFWRNVDAHLELFEYCKGRGINLEAARIESWFGTLGTKYEEDVGAFGSVVHKILDLGIGFTEPFWRDSYRELDEPLRIRLMQRGFASYELAEYIRTHYKANRECLKDVLLDADLANEGVAPVIWDVLLHVGWDPDLKEKNVLVHDFDRDFVASLIEKGLPLNFASNYRSSWLRSLKNKLGSKETRGEVKDSLIEMGFNEEVSEKCRAKAEELKLSYYFE